MGTLVSANMLEGLNEADLYTFQTVAEATAASPGANVTEFHVLSYSANRSGGGGIYRYTPTPTTDRVITCANGRKYELQTLIADIRMFGAISTSVAAIATNNTAITSAIAYCKAKNAALFIPPGDWYVNATFVIDYAINMFGCGPNSRILYREAAGTLFRINLGASGQIAHLAIKNMTLYASYTAATAHTMIAIDVVGTGDCYLQFAHIQDIKAHGWRTFFYVGASSHVTAFGNEGPVNWSKFINIEFLQTSDMADIGFLFGTGSGTGNEFYFVSGFINDFVWLYQGNEGVPRVVGDIIILGGHWGSYNTTSSKVFAVGDNMQYRSRIRLQSLQIDAGMKSLLQLSTTGNPSFGEVIADVALGGNANMGNYPALNSSSLGFTRTNIPAA